MAGLLKRIESLEKATPLSPLEERRKTPNPSGSDSLKLNPSGLHPSDHNKTVKESSPYISPPGTNFNRRRDDPEVDPVEGYLKEVFKNEKEYSNQSDTEPKKEDKKIFTETIEKNSIPEQKIPISTGSHRGKTEDRKSYPTKSKIIGIVIPILFFILLSETAGLSLYLYHQAKKTLNEENNTELSLPGQTNRKLYLSVWRDLKPPLLFSGLTLLLFSLVLTIIPEKSYSTKINRRQKKIPETSVSRGEKHPQSNR